jgi:hypothetical protein
VLVGSFGSVSVTSTGTGGIYIAGANESVALDLRGISSAYVQPAQPSTAITGTAAGINTVQARAAAGGCVPGRAVGWAAALA